MRSVCMAFLIFITLGALSAAVAQERGVDVRTVRRLPSAEKRWALLVGVSDYEDGNITDLNGARDAVALKEALVRYAGFPENQIILLTTDEPRERQPTRENLIKQLANLKRSVPPDGLLLFSFSGHGTESQGQAFLLPSAMLYDDDFETLNAMAVGVEFVKSQIRAMKVPQILIFLDACRNDPTTGRSDTANPLTEAYRRGFRFDVRNREVEAFATIYATSVGHRAYEYAEKGMGYFTWAVVEALKGGAANERGEVTLHGLKKFVEEQVPREVRQRLGKAQKPFAVIEGYKEDELVIAVTAYSSKWPRPDERHNAAFYVERGQRHLDMKNYDQAVNDFNAAIQLDSQNVEAYSSLCLAHNNRDSYNDAIIACNKAIRIDPKYGDAHDHLGVVYFNLGKYDLALEHHTTAIRLDPNFANAYGNRCAAHLALGDHARAVEDCEKAINLNPRQANAYNNLATAHTQKGDHTAAVRNYEIAVSLDSENEGYYKNLCGAYVNSGDFSRAITTCNRAIQLNPNYGPAYNNLGASYYYMGKYDEAIRHLSVAVKLDPQDAEAHNNIGAAYFSKGEFAQAVDWLTRAINLDPRDASTYRNRAEAYKKMGNEKQAREDLKKAEELGGTGRPSPQ